MAIDNREHLEHTQQKIAELERALEEMKREEPPKVYAILSKGFVAQIEHMRREIDEYLGIGRDEVEEPELVTR
jgi:TATA-binding protein-associated factor Taf7